MNKKSPMKKIDWQVLEHLILKDVFRHNLTNIEKKTMDELVELTRQEDEHPEWYDCWCECQLCMSYAD